MKRKIIINQYEQVTFGVTIILDMKVKVIEIKQTLSIEEYFHKIRSYLKDIINNLKKSDMWKIQLTASINFTFTLLLL